MYLYSLACISGLLPASLRSPDCISDPLPVSLPSPACISAPLPVSLVSYLYDSVILLLLFHSFIIVSFPFLIQYSLFLPISSVYNHPFSSFPVAILSSCIRHLDFSILFSLTRLLYKYISRDIMISTSLICYPCCDKLLITFERCTINSCWTSLPLARVGHFILDIILPILRL